MDKLRVKYVEGTSTVTVDLDCDGGMITLEPAALIVFKSADDEGIDLMIPAESLRSARRIAIDTSEDDEL